jgi:hypothetical protein
MIPLSPRQSRGKIAATAGARQAIFPPGDSAVDNAIARSVSRKATTLDGCADRQAASGVDRLDRKIPPGM